MQYDILKDFKGSPDGRHAVQYKAGETEVELTPSLAEVALAEKWVKPSKASKKQAKDKSDTDETAAKAEAEKQAAIELLRTEIAQLEEEGLAAMSADPTGETAKSIQEKWNQRAMGS